MDNSQIQTDDQYYPNLITNMILQGYTPQESVTVNMPDLKKIAG